MTTPLAAAQAYLQRGWYPLPVPHMRKGPQINGWNKLRLTADELPNHFNGKPQNIGIILGEPSGWLVDIDLDCPEAVRLAPRFLPATARFGRNGSPGSHWLYIAPELAAKGYHTVDPAKQSETICEIRSTNQQTVFPPSTHPSGESIRWESGDTPIARMGAAALQDAVDRLAIASALARHGVPDDTAADWGKDVDALPDELPGWVCVAIRAWFKPAPAVEQQRGSASSDLDEAAKSYNADHPKDYGKGRGDCPICKHHDCFGAMNKAPERWSCFSTAHGTVGVQGANCRHGDPLDLDAYAAGITRVELLRRDGYLAPTEPKARQTQQTAAAQTRPAVQTTRGNGHEDIAAALPILASSTHVYQRAQKLVSIAGYSRSDDDRSPINREQGSPVILPMSSGRLWEIMSGLIRWDRWDGRSEDWLPCDPPDRVVSAIHTRGDWPGLPTIQGLVTIPILRTDGSLCVRPGYDCQTGLYYAPVGEPPTVADAPTQLDAELACQQLKEVVQDFPFAEQCHRSAWLSTVLSRVAWGAFQGGAPLTIIDATTPGTGKTLLADVSALISTGAVAARSPYVESDDEMRKRITSHLMAGDQCALIDNVPAGVAVGWPSLDCALTGELWSDRELGSNSICKLPMGTLWTITGNNLGVGADAARRSLRIRLESREERPEERTGFRHAPLDAWVRHERTRLLGAALTMLRAYICAGKPDQGLVPIGSFEGWSALVRAAIVWAGEDDPAGARASLGDDVDEIGEAHKALLSGWAGLEDLSGGDGLTCAQILKQVAGDMDKHASLVEAIGVLCPTNDGSLPPARKFGKKLRSLKGRVRVVDGAGLRIVGAMNTDAKVMRWRVASEKSTGSTGLHGVCSIPNVRTVSGSLGTPGINDPVTPRTPRKPDPEPPAAADDDGDDEVPF